MSKTAGTPLTMEMFEVALFPRIEELFDEKVHQIEIKVLESEERIVGELQALRDESAATFAQYERTNKRVDKIDRHLRINSLMDDE